MVALKRLQPTKLDTQTLDCLSKAIIGSFKLATSRVICTMAISRPSKSRVFTALENESVRVS